MATNLSHAIIVSWKIEQIERVIVSQYYFLIKYWLKSSTTADNGTHRTKYLNKVQLKPRFNESLNLQISSLVGCFKKIHVFLVFSICFHKTVHNKWCLDKIIWQIENDLECGFVKHWLNFVEIFGPKGKHNTLFTLYVLFSQFRPCDDLQGICLLSCTWMHMHKTKFEKNSSLGYHHVVWNGKTKLAS